MLAGTVGKRFTDEELVGQIKDGNRESLDALVKVYLPEVYNRVQSLLPERDAEDLTQEIFLNFVDSIERFRDGSTLAAWFHKITMCKVADYYREVSRSRKEKDNTQQKAVPAELSREHMDMESTVKEALVNVPDPYRGILLLKFSEGLSFGDIAGKLGLTYEATISRYLRAMRILRKNWSIIAKENTHHSAMEAPN